LAAERTPDRRKAMRSAALLAGIGLAAAGFAFFVPLVGLLLSCLLFPVGIWFFEGISGRTVPKRFTGFVLLFSLAALFAGEWSDLYETLPWWDLALHGISAAVLSGLGVVLALIPSGGARPHASLWIATVLGFCFSMMVGTMWEVMEFTLDMLFGTNAQERETGVLDTMWDIIVNLAGAVAGALATHRALRTGQPWPPGGMALAFLERNPELYPAWSGPLPRREARGGVSGTDRPLQGGGQARRDVIAGQE
jgi:hypothetical protein